MKKGVLGVSPMDPKTKQHIGVYCFRNSLHEKLAGSGLIPRIKDKRGILNNYVAPFEFNYYNHQATHTNTSFQAQGLVLTSARLPFFWKYPSPVGETQAELPGAHS